MELKPYHVRIFKPSGSRYELCENTVLLDDWLASELSNGYIFKSLVGLVDDPEARIRVMTEYDPDKAANHAARGDLVDLE